MNRLTEVQKREILKLKNEGKGYKSISKIMGISASTIAYVLKKESLVYRCEFCGKEYEKKPGTRSRRFCSHICRSKWWKRNKCLDDICLECGALFKHSPSDKKKFCSRECFQKNMKRKWGKLDG